MVKIEKNYGYMGPGDGNQRYYMTEGQYMSGQTIGIMVLEAALPFLPGNVANAESYDFPVRYLLVPGANQARMHVGDPTLLPALIETAKQLEIDGCRAICANCGYYGHFQAEVAAAVDVPVFLSAVIQVPWILTGLKKDQKIGILCGDGPNLNYHLFESCGVTKEQYERCVIYGAQDEPEFSTFVHRPGHFHNGKIHDEIVGLAEKMVAEHPEVGAILLECTDMPPYAAEIQKRTNLPVFDPITMINYVHSGIARKPFYGFM